MSHEAIDIHIDINEVWRIGEPSPHLQTIRGAGHARGGNAGRERRLCVIVYSTRQYGGSDGHAMRSMVAIDGDTSRGSNM